MGHSSMTCWPVAWKFGAEMFNGAGFINFVEEEICWLYGNAVRMVSDRYRRFNNSEMRAFVSFVGIRWKRTSSNNSRVNAKVERMVLTHMRAVQKGSMSKRTKIGIRAWFRYWEVIGDDLIRMESLLSESCSGSSPVSHLRHHIIGQLYPTLSLFPDSRLGWLRLWRYLKSFHICLRSGQYFDVGDTVLVRRGRRKLS